MAATNANAGRTALPVRRDIAELEEYAAVEPPERLAARLGLRPEQIVKLDANENPYGPSPKVLDALRHTDFSVYPDPFHTRMREAISSFAGAPAERILFGNGADELLELVIRLVIEPGDAVINCPPTFGMYSFLPPLFFGQVTRVPRRDDFSVDVDGVLEALEPRAKLIILTSPNNPSGNLLPRADLIRLLETGRLVLLDEAYTEFAGNTAIPLAAHYDNLVVLRTFSKWAGLAGLRAGWGVFSAEIIRHLWKIKQPYNVNVAAEAAVIASLDDRDYLLTNVRKIIAERKRLFEALSSLAGWQVYPSESNFLLCRIRGEGGGTGARAVKEKLSRQGVIVRSYFNQPALADCLRISVGRPEQTDRLMAALTDASSSIKRQAEIPTS